MRRMILKALLQTHTLLYKCINRIAVSHDSIHPKHALIDYGKFFLDNIKEGDVVLDVGCGVGIIERTLAKKAGRIVAIDINQNYIDKARKLNSFPNVDYIIADAMVYDYDSNFDAVVISNVLEHMEHRVDFLSRMANIAKKILIRVPLLDRDWITLYKKQLGLEYRLDKSHYKEYTLNSFIAETESAGLVLLSHYTRFGELYAVLTKRTDT